MPEHTPGPWSVAGYLPNLYIIGADGADIAMMFRTRRCGIDACLIAAAPLLLAACKMALHDFEDYWTARDAELQGVIDVLSQAITAAEGNTDV